MPPHFLIMIYIFLFFLVFFLFLKVNSKFISPYTAIHIVGKKGSGKSTLMVKMMIRDIKNGWNVYTDIPDINLEKVNKISLSVLKSKIPPPKSAIYLDEVGLSLDNRKFKEFDDGLRDFIALMRHYKVKVITASQAVDIDLKWKNRLDSYILVTNVGMFSLVRPIVSRYVLTDPVGDSEAHLTFRLKFGGFSSWRLIFLPLYWPAFDSFQTPFRPQVNTIPVSGETCKIRDLRFDRFVCKLSKKFFNRILRFFKKKK